MDKLTTISWQYQTQVLSILNLISRLKLSEEEGFTKSCHVMSFELWRTHKLLLSYFYYYQVYKVKFYILQTETLVSIWRKRQDTTHKWWGKCIKFKAGITYCNTYFFFIQSNHKSCIVTGKQISASSKSGWCVSLATRFLKSTLHVLL